VLVHAHEQHTLILTQVRAFIDGAYQRTLALLREKKELVEGMAQVGNEKH
jgi:ATP-dependent Zn protease